MFPYGQFACVSVDSIPSRGHVLGYVPSGVTMGSEPRLSQTTRKGLEEKVVRVGWAFWVVNSKMGILEDSRSEQVVMLWVG